MPGKPRERECEGQKEAGRSVVWTGRTDDQKLRTDGAPTPRKEVEGGYFRSRSPQQCQTRRGQPQGPSRGMFGALPILSRDPRPIHVLCRAREPRTDVAAGLRPVRPGRLSSDPTPAARVQPVLQRHFFLNPSVLFASAMFRALGVRGARSRLSREHIREGYTPAAWAPELQLLPAVVLTRLVRCCVDIVSVCANVTVTS